MATTRFITHHISKGQTIAKSLSERLGYGKNPIKTRNGELIKSYMCDHETADAEFLLAKAKYKAITGREQKQGEDVLCYQIRQSFKCGELDHETALKVGYSLAMRWTKGEHAFFVASHVDRPNPHIHIYYNSTALDCTRKFRDFKGSARAVRRLSDRICYENGLSVIENPKPKSKGQYKHYGEWMGNNRPMSFKEQLKAAVDNALQQMPQGLNAFISIMSEAGFKHKWRRGVLSFCADGQKKYARLKASTLGDGYGLEDIQAIIEGRDALPKNRAEMPQGATTATIPKSNLIVDIQEKMRSGKGAAYERWAKIHNLKAMAAALQFLQENNLMGYEQLEQRAMDATECFHALSDKIKSIEAAININSELRDAMINYAKTRPVFEGYKAAKYSNKYLAENETDIQNYRVAQATFKRILSGAKLPKMEVLKSEFRRLSVEKNTAYKEYRAVRKSMQDIVTTKANIDHLLELTDPQKNKEVER